MPKREKWGPSPFKQMKVLVTGVAGFIGMHCARRLLGRGDEVIGVDNLSPYYSVELKRARLKEIAHRSLRFQQLDIADAAQLTALFEREKPAAVLHLAAQAGVRYSLVNPASYVQSNLVGFANVLEACRAHPPRHLVFASSSSVYGKNAKLPWSETDNVDHPISLYAATKKANELMAHAYSHLYGLPTTGLRFFTVYGPWGRPDMALFLFTKAILEGRPVDVFNQGKMQRDFTYIDDVVEAVVRVLDRAPRRDPNFKPDVPDPATSWAPYRIYNVGNHQPVDLMTYIEMLEKALGKTAKKNFMPLQDGDVTSTFADTDDIRSFTDFAPATPVEEGIGRFVAWYRSHYAA